MHELVLGSEIQGSFHLYMENSEPSVEQNQGGAVTTLQTTIGVEADYRHRNDNIVPLIDSVTHCTFKFNQLGFRSNL